MQPHILNLYKIDKLTLRFTYILELLFGAAFVCYLFIFQSKNIIFDAHLFFVLFFSISNGCTCAISAILLKNTFSDVYNIKNPALITICSVIKIASIFVDFYYFDFDWALPYVIAFFKVSVMIVYVHRLFILKEVRDFFENEGPETEVQK